MEHHRSTSQNGMWQVRKGSTMKVDKSVVVSFGLLAIFLTLLLSACGSQQPTTPTLETAASETERIWRAQIRIYTADVGDAGTDDDVNVSLNSSDLTWLDYGRDDFERGSVFAYDLNLAGLSTFSKVNQIKITKSGTDGLCLKAFELLLNDRSVYYQSFSGCHWLDGNDGHRPSYSVTSSTLRNSSRWKNYTRPPLTTIAHLERAELESRIEGMLGHLIYYNDLYWGKIYGRAVEVTKSSLSNAIHVDLDMAYDVRFAFDPEVDVDFDLVFSCSSGVVKITMKNLKIDVDSAWYSKVLIIGSLIDYLGNKIGSAASQISKTISINTGGTVCPRFYVSSLGDVYLIP